MNGSVHKCNINALGNNYNHAYMSNRRTTDRKEVGAPFGLFADGRRGVGSLGYIDT